MKSAVSKILLVPTFSIAIAGVLLSQNTPPDVFNGFQFRYGAKLRF